MLFKVPSLFKVLLPNREKPGDVECCKPPANGKPHPGTEGDTHATSITECPGAVGVENEDPVPYEPLLGEILGEGSTSRIARVAPGVIIKYPRFSWWHSKTAADKWFVRDMKRSFEVEERLLQILGIHPRIIEFKGVSDDPFGLLFAEASDGNLQNYIDQHHARIDLSIRFKWRTQAAEAIQFIHQKGVIHSDLRPENFLLHTIAGNELDLLLCDFGGSTNGEIDGRHLPDSGFFNPCDPPESTKATDIFSLGSIYYTIMTGHWPYRSPGPFKSLEEMKKYQELVDDLFASKRYPPVDGLEAGVVIQRCWTAEYSDLTALIADQSSQFETLMRPEE
ncbi:kinase-like domain-containing protein [Aspergillus pseudodeflectus]|uniref:EKC/KEOPS complex subunit BUD32 n=1 Tax=Aspergillus pseudodeflectus TaxID=176178 RepID=A0ABR4L560_9EURO